MQTENHRIRSFVLRQGHLSNAQENAIQEGTPQWGIPYTPQFIDLKTYFNRSAPTFLEIGFGMGQATAHIAKAHPQHNYLGVEVHTPGVGALYQLIKKEEISNILVIRHDAVDVLENMIAPDSLAGIHIFFPDPWPKKRHHKRRLIQPEFVRLLASRLEKRGYLHLATDWEDYAQQMLAILRAEPLLKNTAADFAERPKYRPLTKFEQRGLKLGHAIWDIIFVKVSP